LDREIIAEVYPWESRIAIVEDGRLVEIFWANKDENVGNIYKGKVKDILPGLSCAFIDIGLSKNAFLYAGDIIIPGMTKGSNTLDLLKSGQDIMVQVKKEAFSEKGARVTGNLSIPGHFTVLLPYQMDISISRKLTNSHRREHLRQLLERHKLTDMGIILRTACQDAEDEEILKEIYNLIKVWEDINQRFEHRRAPSLIYEDIDVLERTLRDYLDGDIRRVVVNNERLKKKIIHYMNSKKSFRDFTVQFEEGDLCEKYGLEKDIRRSLRRKVWLRNGGYLIINETEAMIVIDVNSGKFTGKNDFEETVFNLNMEAAVEIPRQLRLRSLGGIILIDFIDMKNKDNEDKVIHTLKRELSKDKAHTRIVGITGLGFLEMTRKKSRYGISKFFMDECSSCNGRGKIINLLAISCEIKRKLVNMGYVENETICCETNPRVCEYIQSDDKNLAYIENNTQKKVKLLANPDLNLGDYKIYTY
jgi:ribonuclease G